MYHLSKPVTQVTDNYDKSSDPTSLIERSPSDWKFPLYKSRAELMARRLSDVLPDAAHKLYNCTNELNFAVTGDGLKLSQLMEYPQGSYPVPIIRWCRQPYCPICQWRKRMVAMARLFRDQQQIEQRFSTGYSWFLMTLTVSNPAIANMRSACDKFSKVFGYFSRQLRDCGGGKSSGNTNWIFDGYFRALELTRGNKPGCCHPHYHLLLIAPTNKYVDSDWNLGKCTKADLARVGAWLSSEWRRYMKLDYNPQVDFQEVNHKQRKDGSWAAPLEIAMVEVAKYCVKISDLWTKDDSDLLPGAEGDYARQRPFDLKDFVPQYILQMKGVRRYSRGGVLKEYFSALDSIDNANLVKTSDEDGLLNEAATQFERYEWVV